MTEAYAVSCQKNRFLCRLQFLERELVELCIRIGNAEDEAACALRLAEANPADVSLVDACYTLCLRLRFVHCKHAASRCDDLDFLRFLAT